MRSISSSIGLVTPSVLSGTVVVLAALSILVLSNISFLINSGLLYESLLGQGSSQDFVQSSHDTVSLFTNNVFSNPTLTKVLFFGFWMMIGMFAYVSVMSISSMLGEASQDLATMHYLHAQAHRVRQELLQRLALRTAAVLAILLWSWVVFKFLLPFCILSVRVGLNDAARHMAVFHLLLGLIVLVLVLHFYVILVRLLALRPRLFTSYTGA